MIRHRLVPQQPLEVYPVPAGFFQFPCCVDTTLVSVYQNLEQHSWIGDRFPSSGRIRCIQFPVIQFLKLGVGQPYGCLFRQHNFAVQCKYQLTVPLNYVTLFQRLVFLHTLKLNANESTSQVLFGPTWCFCYSALFCNAPLGRQKCISCFFPRHLLGISLPNPSNHSASFAAVPACGSHSFDLPIKRKSVYQPPRISKRASRS